MKPLRPFTVEEVDELIPYLEEILGKAREEAFQIQLRRDKLQVLDALWGDRVREPDNPDHYEYLRHRQRERVAGERVEALIREEVIARGIRFPPGGLEHGLLDFPTTFEGRWVFLCWKSGEPRVSAWHEVDGGYAGRQPITAAQARVMGRSRLA